jgi:hypothetical protein
MFRRRFLGCGVGLLGVAALAGPGRAAEGGPTPAAGAAAGGVTEVAVRPSRTDPAIRTFDEPHLVFVHRGIVVERAAGQPAARGELLLFLPGTSPAPAAGSAARGGRPGAAEFCHLAANLGYHAIFLRYPNAQSASACARDEDAGEFERFRLAIIRGGASRHITVAREESIEHRVIRLLAHLQQARPREDWARFLTAEGGIRWEKIAVAGQSQGGGHAVLIGLRHQVARVIATGAPKDFSVRHGRPAPWLGAAGSATPRGRFFTFNHVQDRQAATYAQQLENLRALGLAAFGPPVNVDTAAPPYGGTRILVTDFPGGRTLSSREAHTAVISGRNAAHFDPVWRYLLTAPVE